MDALIPIVAGMTAILFGWIGYFLGNAFPVTAKAKQAKEKRKTLRELEGTENPIKGATQKAIDWLLEREEDALYAALIAAADVVAAAPPRPPRRPPQR